MDTQTLDALAAEMLAAHDHARPLAPIAARWPQFDVPAAYAVADRVHRARMARGWRPVGRKIGFTNFDMWARYGVRAPIWAHVYDRTVFDAAAQPVAGPLAAWCEPKIEPEIVFGLGRAPRADGDLDALLDCIDWMALGFEIVQSHAPGWRFTAADTVADCALHAALWIGARQPRAALGPDLRAQLESFSVRLMRTDGGAARLVETGYGRNVLGSPLVALAHLVQTLAGQPHAAPLAAGELVTTGTITTAQTVAAGEQWDAHVDGVALQSITLRLAP